ncbi:MAG: NADH-quinone oxidoreductase subunit NuoE [Actinomycetota bacterium]|nr:NADH-quinone oxidoreductase subunit NuoE [Actinomycetota bacterium]
MPISDRTRVEAREIMSRYPRARSALLPMLHLVQSEHGYVTPEGVAMCAEELGLTKAEVGAVATFYTMFKRRPAGEYLVSVCTNTLCGFLGGEEIFTALTEHLGVGHDQTTADGQITLEHAECLAACDFAPVLTVNYEFYDQQDTDSALGLVRDLQAGIRRAPTRGAALCSFKEISRQLAGFYDAPIDQEAPSSGEPTLAGNRVALERGHESPAFDPDTPVVPAPPPDSVSRQSATPADPTPAGGQTAHQTSTDKAVDAADTPAEAAGAEMADPDTNEETLAPDSGPPIAPPTPAAAAAPATGAPTGPGSTAPPQARRTRTRGRSGGQAKIDSPDNRSDSDGRN